MMVRDAAEIGGGQGRRGGPRTVQGHPPPHPHLQGRAQHAFSLGPPCASPAGLPGVGAMTGGRREASGQQPGLPPPFPEHPSLHLCLTPPEGHPPQRVPYLGTQRGCRAPPGWPLLGRMCPRGRGRAGNGCAGLGPLQGLSSSGSRWTREPRVSSPAHLQGKGWETAWDPARRGWLGATGVRSVKLRGREKGS